MRNSGEKRLQRFITTFCALFFALFSFTFVAMYKSPVIEIVYDGVATGKLQYNGYILSGVLTILLVGLALWLNRFAKFRREWTAMAFLPSALLLAFVTDIERTVFTGGASLSGWLWVFVAGLFFYAFLAFLFGRMLFEKIKNPNMAANRIVWRNLVLLSIIFMLVGYLSSSDKNFMREALQYKHYRAGESEAALAVGAHSPLASQQLSAQRAFLLSLRGELGERLFEFPQYFGAEGLLPAVERTTPIAPDTVYAHIGLVRDSLETAEDYLARAVSGDSVSIVAREYYLVSLLLERRIVDFADAVYEYYNMGDSLPRHYREALVLYSHVVPEYSIPFDDLSLRAMLEKMVEEAGDKDSRVLFSPHFKEEYGSSYWWYFFYGG